MGAVVFYASLENPELEKVTIELQEIRIIDVNSIEDSARLQVVFLVGNPSEKTFTIPLITYDLYADGEPLGPGAYSTEDVAMPGRAAFYAGVEIPLKNTFKLTKSAISDEIYDAVIGGENLDYSIDGIVTVETSWSLIEKSFQDEKSLAASLN